MGPDVPPPGHRGVKFPHAGSTEPHSWSRQPRRKEDLMGPIHGNPPQSGAPPRQGLYDPANEHDACGVAFVATLRGAPTREIVEAGLTALKNLDHRGAVGAEENTGDGAGILLQVPDAFLRAELGFELPDPGHYAVGMAFLPGGTGASTERAAAVAAVERIAAEEGLRVLGWREVPVVADLVGPMARSTMPA